MKKINVSQFLTGLERMSLADVRIACNEIATEIVQSLEEISAIHLNEYCPPPPSINWFSVNSVKALVEAVYLVFLWGDREKIEVI
jgi:hypothetical protein